MLFILDSKIIVTSTIMHVLMVVTPNDITNCVDHSALPGPTTIGG